jgi:hypothetical protein
MAEKLAPKHRRWLTIWEVVMSSREEISEPGNQTANFFLGI